MQEDVFSWHYTVSPHSVSTAFPLHPQNIWGGETPWAILCRWGTAFPPRAIALKHCMKIKTDEYAWDADLSDMREKSVMAAHDSRFSCRRCGQFWLKLWQVLRHTTHGSLDHKTSYENRIATLVGGVAQWLERRSLTGELSLIYAWTIADVWHASWVRCLLWINQPGQLSLPSLRGRWMSSNQCNYGGGNH